MITRLQATASAGPRLRNQRGEVVRLAAERWASSVIGQCDRSAAARVTRSGRQLRGGKIQAALRLASRARDLWSSVRQPRRVRWFGRPGSAAGLVGRWRRLGDRRVGRRSGLRRRRRGRRAGARSDGRWRGGLLRRRRRVAGDGRELRLRRVVGVFRGTVSRPTGSVPATGKACSPRSRMSFIRGTRIEPRGSFAAPCTSGYWITARYMWSRGCRWRPPCTSPIVAGSTEVWTSLPIASMKAAGSVEEAAVDDAIACSDHDLALAGGAGEVALAGRLADAGVGEGRLAVEVVPAGVDREAVEPVLVVAGVAQGPADGDVDAAERIDDADEAREVHLGPAIDADAEQLSQARGEHRLTGRRAGELAGVAIGVRHEPVDLRPEDPTVAAAAGRRGRAAPRPSRRRPRSGPSRRRSSCRSGPWIDPVPSPSRSAGP